MSNHSFTDSDGDTYTVEPSESRTRLSLTFKSPESAGMEFIIFNVEDAERLAAMILEAAQETRK